MPEAFGGHFAVGSFLEPSLRYGAQSAPAIHHGSHSLVFRNAKNTGSTTSRKTKKGQVWKSMWARF